ncbi:MAG: hypothetical protein ACFFC1_18120 [Promethearchaeota archaeon]
MISSGILQRANIWLASYCIQSIIYLNGLFFSTKTGNEAKAELSLQRRPGALARR